MPEPTEDEIRRVLAEKVLGWRIESTTYGLWHYYDGNGKISLFGAEDWNPLRNIEQAFQVLKAMVGNGFCPSLVYDDDGKWGLSFSGVQQIDKECDWDNVMFGKETVWCKEPAEAIARACYEAVKEE